MNCKEGIKYSLNDICTKIGSGSTPRGGSSVYEEHGVTFIRSQNIYNNYFLNDGLVYINDEAAYKLRSVEVIENDILLNITGDSVARCTIVPSNVLPARVNQHVCIIRANTSIVDYAYLKYFLVNPRMQSYMLSIAYGGGTRAALTKGMIENFEISLPSLEQQKKTSALLLSIDNKIELNNQMNKTLEEMAQVLFKRWFVDFEFPNEYGEPYKSSGGEMVESELGMIPKGWRVDKIGSIATIIRGASPRPIQEYISQEGMPWVKISDATSSSTKYLYRTNEFIKREGIQKSRKIDKGTLILSNSATPGLPMISLIEACVHDGWLIFNDYKDVSKEFLYYYLKDNREKILALSNGSVFRNLKTDILKSYNIIIPEESVINKITEVFKKYNDLIIKNVYEISTLIDLRDSLLPKLMNGEIRVEDIEANL